MKRTIGIVLILAGVGLGIWGFMRHEEREPDVKIGELEIGVDKGKDYPVTVLVVAGIALVAGLVTVSGKRA